MKLPAKYKPEKVTRPEDNNEALRSCHLEADRSRIIATNRHSIVIVPVEVSEEDTTGMVSAEALKGARKEAASVQRAKSPEEKAGTDPAPLELECSKYLSTPEGEDYGRPEPAHAFPFPKVDNALTGLPYRDDDPEVCIVGLNAQLLLDLASALGQGAKQGHGVELRIKMARQDVGDWICTCGETQPYAGGTRKNCSACRLEMHRESRAQGTIDPIEVRIVDTAPTKPWDKRPKAHDEREPLAVLMPMRV